MKTHTDNLFAALGHLQQAKLLIDAVLEQDPDTHELCDAQSLTDDALVQLKGELRNRQENRRVA